jgi:serine/threonine protein kinase HipA of HipAB toxin-antitoxin module
MPWRNINMQHSESTQGFFQPAANYFGNYGPPLSPRKLVLGSRVTMARKLPPPALDADVVSHWLAEYAARAQFDALREEQLQL